MQHSIKRATAKCSAILLVALLSVSGPQTRAQMQSLAAESAQAADPINSFDKQVVMLAMRDGVKLNTEIYTPKNSSKPLPILFWRSPYGVSEVGAGSPGGSVFATSLKALVDDGYIIVFQDIRGRHKSEGEFVMLRPKRTSKDAIDETTDAYDSIAWLIRNIPNNNCRVGMLGVSYSAWLSAVAATDPHPALKAVAPQASPYDVFISDDFFNNGAFRLSYGFEYVAFLERGTGRDVFEFGTWDTYEWYLRQGSLAGMADRHLKGLRTTWDDFVAHPSFDAFWKTRSIASMGPAKVPSLNVGGWFDSEDRSGPVLMQRDWAKRSQGGEAYLVMGPWTHGGSLGSSGRAAGPLDFGSDTAPYFQQHILRPWFAKYLKSRSVEPMARVQLFETGSNKWVSLNEWPDAKVRKRALYFRADGKLSFEPPSEAGEETDSYISDPANPVPYRPRPIEGMFLGEGWSQWQTIDQRFADDRPDVRTWVSDPLEDDLVLSGDIVANLFAATTGTDSDWIVKLIDVYPGNYAPDPKRGGFQALVSGGIIRGRYRKDLETAIPIPANHVEQYRIELPAARHRFLKGHRLMVQVQSSWFPLYDRNPQRFVPNIFLARDGDFRAATQSVHRDKAHPSHLMLNVMD